MVLQQTRTKNKEEKAGALCNAQNVACGSCSFCATYPLSIQWLMATENGIPTHHIEVGYYDSVIISYGIR
jgi:hypothetical protein